MEIEALKNMMYDFIIAVLKMNAPKKTGNLAYNSIRRVEDRVVIGGEIAPYAEKTETKNRSSKGWIDRTMLSIFPTLESMAKGSLSQEAVQKLIDEANLDVQRQFNDLADEYYSFTEKLRKKKRG